MMSNPKALRDKFLRIMYDLRNQEKLTQGDVLTFKAVFEAGLQVLYNECKPEEKQDASAVP